MKLTPKNRLAHKSSFWTRSAIVRARSASERKLVLPHQTRKLSERLWESLAEKVPHGVRKRVQFS